MFNIRKFINAKNASIAAVLVLSLVLASSAWANLSFVNTRVVCGTDFPKFLSELNDKKSVKVAAVGSTVNTSDQFLLLNSDKVNEWALIITSPEDGSFCIMAQGKDLEFISKEQNDKPSGSPL